MPVVDLPSFGQIVAPGNHHNPATRDDVNVAATYKGRIDAIFLHNAHGITGADLAAAHLHLQETSTSFLNAQPGANQAPPGNQEILVALQNINENLQRLREDMAIIREIALEGSITAQTANRTRAEGSVLPLIPIRYPNGRLPEEDRPVLNNLAAVNALSFQMARAYARSYCLRLPRHATRRQYQEAIAKHIGAIS